MKKLNRKGFTLVELLAVIIILAIVVGITIPAILNTTTSAKQKAFQTAAETTADWIERQYQTKFVDENSVDPNYLALFKATACSSLVSGKTYCYVHADGTANKTKGTNYIGLLYPNYKSRGLNMYYFNSTYSVNLNDMIEVVGLKKENVSSIKFMITSDNRVCLILGANTTGDYAKAGKFKSNGAAGTNQDYAMGGTCTGVSFT